MAGADSIDLSGQKLLGLREGDLTAVDTETELTTWGSDAAPGALNLETPVRTIVVTVATDGAATGSAGFIARLRGTGSEQFDMPAGAIGGTLATTSIARGFVLAYKVTIELKGRVRLFGEMVGADTGTARLTIALYG